MAPQRTDTHACCYIFFQKLSLTLCFLTDMGRDENTPIWTQHLALKVKDIETLLATKDKLIKDGIDVLGPVNHTLFYSIYFFDPSGHRIELACDVTTDKMSRALDKVKWEMLNEWADTKKAPKHAQWVHDGTEPPDDN